MPTASNASLVRHPTAAGFALTAEIHVLSSRLGCAASPAWNTVGVD
jgi:hypothetical protein